MAFLALGFPLTLGGIAATATKSLDVSCERGRCDVSWRDGFTRSARAIEGERLVLSMETQPLDSDDGSYDAALLVVTSESARVETTPSFEPSAIDEVVGSLQACRAERHARCETHRSWGCGDVLWGLVIGPLMALGLGALVFRTSRIEIDDEGETIRIYTGRLGWASLAYEGRARDVSFHARFDRMGDDADIHVLEAFTAQDTKVFLARGGEEDMQRREREATAFVAAARAHRPQV